jgi:predicted amidohydrolase YtcJ
MRSTARPSFARCAIALASCLLLDACAPNSAMRRFWLGTDVTLYPARQVITMNADQPTAQAVAIEDDRIVGVGSVESIVATLGDRSFEVDRRFEDKILVPGFIEPHLHPYIAGILLPMKFITPHAWSLPGRDIPAVRGRGAYLARLAAHEASLEDPQEWLWTWGFHHLFHGELSRADLDAISNQRPILVWHRSFHEIFANTAALAALGIDRARADAHTQVDFDRGHFYETGLELLLEGATDELLQLRRYLGALREARALLHAGGITTVADGAFGTLDLTREYRALRYGGWDDSDTPYRSLLLLDGRALGDRLGHEATRDQILELEGDGTHHLRFLARSVKLFADGAAYSQLMQMKDGYLDGHEGEWIMQPETLLAAARVYWNAGFQIHVHANGDLGVETVLDVLETLQRENPRDDHRFTLHHVCSATPAQAQRAARLGAIVSANPFYVWALADKYAEVGLGPERAARMVPSRSFVDAGVPLAFHSDFTMAPAQPLRLAWAAATRLSADGVLQAPEERISVREALEAITLDAAYQVRMEHEIGSLEVGKLADLTVLEQDPFEVPVEALKDIPIWGTVFEGTVYPIEAP